MTSSRGVVAGLAVLSATALCTAVLLVLSTRSPQSAASKQQQTYQLGADRQRQARVALVGLERYDAVERPTQEADGPAVAQESAEANPRPVSACETLESQASAYRMFTAHAPSANKQHVLVTGGAGFIGSHAVLALLEQGHKVTVIDNLSRGNGGAIAALERLALPNQLFTFILDLAHAMQLQSALRGAGISTVLHFAGVAYVAESVRDPMLYHHNITANTINLMRLAEAINITRVVFSSTCATYGNAAQLPITERTPQRPVTPYGVAKMRAEEIVAAFRSTAAHRSVALLRYFNVYGSDPRGRIGEAPDPRLVRQYGRISNACFDAALGKRAALEITGTNHNTTDGTCVRDYIHVVDLVDAHIAVMGTMKPRDKLVYNIGTGKGYSVREFVAACKAVTQQKIRVVELEARPGDAAAVYADVSKVERELGWKARFTNLETGLLTAWRWARAHPNGYDRHSTKE